MMRYEYKVLPAPKAGLKGKGIKTAEDRFANALATTMNVLAAEGWEYQRTETLPAEKREGLMGKATVFQNMMVFRRPVAEDVVDQEPSIPMVAPIAAEAPEDAVEPVEEEAPAEAESDEAEAEETDEDDAAPSGRRLNFNRESM